MDNVNTIDYEKKYKDALEIAKSFDLPEYKNIMASVFPELKESEDERIRKEIIEKQGKQETLCDICRKYHPSLSCQDITELGRCAVEPKFHEGDWIKHQGTENIYQVVSIIDNKYRLKYIDNYTVQECADVDRCARLWDITKDAKDGDVLATSEGAFIYNGNNGGGSCPGSYCGINTLGGFQTGVEHHWTVKSVFPATKEQRDALRKAMNNAGYEWNDKTKTLEKLIKPKFDPKTLNLFDKVLVKMSNESFNTWYGDFVAEPSHAKNETPLILGAKEANMVIPYNDDTKHLVGATDEAPEYYRYWEG